LRPCCRKDDSEEDEEEEDEEEEESGDDNEEDEEEDEEEEEEEEEEEAPKGKVLVQKPEGMNEATFQEILQTMMRTHVMKASGLLVSAPQGTQQAKKRKQESEEEEEDSDDDDDDEEIEEDSDEDDDDVEEEEEKKGVVAKKPAAKKAKLGEPKGISPNKLPKGWKLGYNTTSSGRKCKCWKAPNGRNFDRWPKVVEYLESLA